MCKHQHNYTALHFAGLSGNSDVCLALLVAGAQPEITNAVNRTAAQMAAFVGHHKCVAIINNYVQKADVDYYTVLQGQQTEPYLPPFLAESFHKLVINVNVHPVKVALNIFNLVGLLQNLPKIKKVLELMSEKEMKKEHGSNEVMAFKFFYLSFVVTELVKIHEKYTNDGEKKIDVLQIFCKNILKPRKDGFLDLLDAFLRECIKEFPFRDCTLFRQMITTLTSKDSPSALSVVNSAINGQRGFLDNISVCNTCGEEKPAKKCSQCKVAQYCDRNCQKLHWYWHKKVCGKLIPEVGNMTNEEKSVNVNELTEDVQKLLVSN